MISDILVDSSVLIDFFKGRETRETSILKELDLRGEPYSVPVVCAQEVMQGANSTKDFQKLWDFFRTQDLVGPKDQLNFYYNSAKIFFDCQKKGKTVRSSIDCMIAQLALENSAYLLTSDKDYRKIVGLRKELRLL